MADEAAGIIREILGDQLHLEVDSDEAELIDSGLLDSLAFVELMFHLEQRFGIQVDLETVDLEDMRTVSRIAGFVGRLTAGATSGPSS